MRGIISSLAFLAGAVSIAPGTAPAQLAGGLIITPYVGLYAPANDVATIGVSSSGIVAPGAKHQSAAAFGATGSYWITNRYAFEIAGAYAASGLRATGAFSTLTADAESAHLWLGAARMMVQLLPSSRDFNLRLGFGPAIIARGGKAYDSNANGRITGLTDLGAAVSLCSRLNLTSALGLRLRLEDYIYQSQLGWRATNPSQSFTFDETTQHDFVLSAGLQLRLNR